MALVGWNCVPRCRAVRAKGEHATIVLGVNEQILKPEHMIVSNASSPTNYTKTGAG